MSFDAPPAAAAWLHRGARLGYEVVFFHDADGGLLIDGCTTATEDGQMWAVSFVINTDTTWTTRSAQITGDRVRCQVDSDALAEVLRLLTTAGVRSLVSQPPTLEELFLMHYGPEEARP